LKPLEHTKAFPEKQNSGAGSKLRPAPEYAKHGKREKIFWGMPRNLQHLFEAGSVDENRAVSIPGHVGSHAPHEKVLQRRMALPGDDDEVVLSLLGKTENFLRGAPLQDYDTMFMLRERFELFLGPTYPMGNLFLGYSLQFFIELGRNPGLIPPPGKGMRYNMHKIHFHVETVSQSVTIGNEALGMFA
jgi:hypothetical protein